jgi:hypothetical protein
VLFRSPSKPVKYGIKIWTLCDSASSYCLKAQVYTGKPPGGTREKNQGMRVVMDLTQELRGQCKCLKICLERIRFV